MKSTVTMLVGVGLMVISGCGRGGIGSVEELAEALRQHGVAYDVSETAALASIRAGGIRLMGENLKVEVYLIDDEKDMKRAATAAALAAMGQSKVAGALLAASADVDARDGQGRLDACTGEVDCRCQPWLPVAYGEER